MKNQNITTLIIGSIFILLGLAFLSDNIFGNVLGFSFFKLICNLWPLIFFGIGISLLVKEKQIFGIIFIIIGTIFLIGNIFNISAWAILWPVILIGIGLMVLFKNSLKINFYSTSKEKSDFEITSFFNEIKRTIQSKKFQSAKINAIFGTNKVDFRKINFEKKQAKIEVFAIFGECEIIIPENLEVDIDMTPIMGSINHEISSQKGSNQLDIHATAVFGEIKIKN